MVFSKLHGQKLAKTRPFPCKSPWVQPKAEHETWKLPFLFFEQTKARPPPTSLCEGPWAWDQALAGWAKPASQNRQRTNQANQQQEPPSNQVANQTIHQPAGQPNNKTNQAIKPAKQINNEPGNQPTNLTCQPNNRAGLEASENSGSGLRLSQTWRCLFPTYLDCMYTWLHDILKHVLRLVLVIALVYIFIPPYQEQAWWSMSSFAL